MIADDEAVGNLTSHKGKGKQLAAQVGEPTNRCAKIRILKAFASVDFDPSYDYKVERNDRKETSIV